MYIYVHVCRGWGGLWLPLKISRQGMRCINVIRADVIFNCQILNPWRNVVVFTYMQYYDVYLYYNVSIELNVL